ncbi:hypothetical protein B0A48_08134 [Cryoendolithus antarcticus]|uniref:Uncharacterized protein n=1 Tax=Cryoendolithus antarcticus TaxID=1507870 RepID=A0A1V8T1A7_9PEZI|nr:hypothetical protein B0A48_08134 [Cryoendolithus antarcticus]
MTSLKTAIAVASSSLALTGAGGIAALSLFDIPELQSQPASRSLPQIRWLFSRGSHFFPSLAFGSGTAFLYLAYDAVPAHLTAIQGLTHAIRGITSLGTPAGRAGGLMFAGLSAFGLGPMTSIMIPTNFRLIELSKAKGGSRSEASAKKAKAAGVKGQNALDSVDGRGQAGQFADLSGPQEETAERTSKAEDEEVRG